MAIKVYKAITNGRRNMTSLDFAEITTNKPEKSLLAPLPKKREEITKVKSLFVTTVEDTKNNTVLLTSREIKTTYQQKLLLSSTIQTVQRTSLYYTM